MKGNDDTGQDETSDSETTEYPGIDDLVETYDIPSEKITDQNSQPDETELITTDSS